MLETGLFSVPVPKSLRGTAFAFASGEAISVGPIVLVKE
jgi:hypothetical protein